MISNTSAKSSLDKIYNKSFQTLSSELFIGKSNPNQQDSTKSLFYSIGLRHKTDKVTHHRYEGIYEKYMSQFVGQPINILEIGLGCGMPYGPGASAHLWREYLGSRANIHFIEYNQDCGEYWYEVHGKKLGIHMHYGSQENITFLDAFMDVTPDFHVIIDDGGHRMKQQITSFKKLLSKVKSSGLYVVEDLLTSYMIEYDGGYLSNSTMIELIKIVIDEIQTASPVKRLEISKRIRSFEISDEICVFILK